MATLFSISIPFQEKEFMALIFAVSCGMMTVLGDKLVFSLQQGLQEPKPLPTMRA